MKSNKELTPLTKNEYHEYKFEIWQLGYYLESHIFSDLFSARKFYANHGNSDSFALKLFIDGKLINFLDMSKVLQISKQDKWRLDLNF